MGFRDEVHIPSHHTHWAASQPDGVLSPFEGFREIDKGDWNSGHASYILDPWQSIVIKKSMGRFLENLASVVDDELRIAVPEYLQVDGEREVNVYESMKWLVAQISSRFTVGLPLCKDPSIFPCCLKILVLTLPRQGQGVLETINRIRRSVYPEFRSFDLHTLHLQANRGVSHYNPNKV